MAFGVAAHVIAAALLIGLVYTTPLTIFAGLLVSLALPITIAGAAFPDIDHPQSKPNRMFRKILFVAGIGATAWVFGQVGFRETYLWFESAGFGEAAFSLAAVATVVVALLGGVGARLLFDILRPSHRGITHRVPTGVGVSIGIGVVTWALAAAATFVAPLLLATVVGGMFFVGFLSHLACDGVLLKPKTYLSFR